MIVGMKLGVIEDGYDVNIAVGVIVGFLERLEGDVEDSNDGDDDECDVGIDDVVADDDDVDGDITHIIILIK